MLDAKGIGCAVAKTIDNLQATSDKVEDVRLFGYTDTYGRDGDKGTYVVKVTGTITQSISVPVID